MESFRWSSTRREPCSTTRATASGVKGGRPSSGDDIGDELGVELLVLGRAVGLGVEVGLDLEELLEVGVDLVEQVVDHRLADEHHLAVERDRLRVQGRPVAVSPICCGQVLDADLAGLEAALERVPGVGLGQQVARLHHEEAAVGAVQGAGLDHGEVGDQGAELGQVLDAADQVGQRSGWTP